MTTIRVGCGNLELDPVGGLDRYRVRVAERELEVSPAQLRAIADALDLEALLEPRGHALHHVRDERTGEAVERAVLAAIGGTGHDDLIVYLLDLHVRD